MRRNASRIRPANFLSTSIIDGRFAALPLAFGISAALNVNNTDFKPFGLVNSALCSAPVNKKSGFPCPFLRAPSTKTPSPVLAALYAGDRGAKESPLAPLLLFQFFIILAFVHSPVLKRVLDSLVPTRLFCSLVNWGRFVFTLYLIIAGPPLLPWFRSLFLRNLREVPQVLRSKNGDIYTRPEIPLLVLVAWARCLIRSMLPGF